MRIPLDRTAASPLYTQIRDFLRAGIASGKLPPETRLPSSRELAHDLGVSRITVDNAYADLEAEGLTEGRHGSGTYVTAREAEPAPGRDSTGTDLPRWQRRIERRARPDSRERMQRLWAEAGPAAISLAGGVTDHRLFPIEDFRRSLQEVIRRDGTEAIGYGDRQGFAPLRRTIAQILSRQGIPAGEEDVLITSGSQQGLALVTQVLLRPGDRVVVESPTYANALDLFASLGLRVRGLPVDEEGMRLDRLERTLREARPRMVYTIPNFQNPTGTCLRGDRRRRLVTLAERYGVPIVEDDFVGDLRYEGSAEPALKALDRSGNVVLIGTFSKMLAPGMRIGYVVAQGPLHQSLRRFKAASDLASSSLMQRALEAYITVGRYQAHLRRACRHYGRRRDLALEAIRRHLPDDFGCRPPHGGMFFWLELPDRIPEERLAAMAAREGVVVTPGRVFFPEARRSGYLRLNFVEHDANVFAEAIRRLARAVRRCERSPQRT